MRQFSATVKRVLRCLAFPISLAFALTFVTAEVVAGPFVLIVNVTVTDAKGNPLAGVAEGKPQVVLRVLNITEQCLSTTCVFNKTLLGVNSTSIQANISIYLFGVLVYKMSFMIENNTQVNLFAKINASTVKINLSNDHGAFLKDCDARIIGLDPKVPALDVASGQKVTLPFGVYNVSTARYKVPRASAPALVPVLNPSFRVLNGTEEVNVRLGVAGAYRLELRKADGSPLAGARVRVAHVEAGNATVFEGEASGGYVTLSNVPYGRYLVTVEWRDETLFSGVMLIDGSRKGVNITTSLLPLVALTVLDADSHPVAGARLRISRAVGGAAAIDVISDHRGQVVLTDVVPGVYTVSSSWRDYPFSVSAYITGTVAEVKLPLRKVKVKIETEPTCSSCSLPPGLSAELLCGEDSLANASLARASAELVVDSTERVYVDAALKLRISWNGIKIFEKELRADVGVVSVVLPFYNLSLKVVDARGRPLPNASLKVFDELGVRAVKSDFKGVAELGFVYGRRVRVEVFWEGVPVAKEAMACTPELVEVKTSVYTVKVEVVNALGQPVVGALLVARVKGLGYYSEQRAVTRDDGAAELRLPAPPDAQVTLEVSKGRVSLARQLLSEEMSGGATRVALDLLLDLGPLQLRVGEFASFVAVAVAVAVAAIYALKVLGRRAAVRGVFEVYGGEAGMEEGEETPWKGVFERFKEIFSSEKAEEEEEEGLFDEL